MKTVTEMLREWETAIGINLPDRLTVPGFETKELRKELLREEFEEYLAATDADDLVEIADALADMEYIIHGTALAYGIDDAVTAEVHRSNMTKVRPDGTVIRREDGKILKPEGYERPNIARVLGLQP